MMISVDSSNDWVAISFGSYDDIDAWADGFFDWVGGSDDLIVESFDCIVASAEWIVVSVDWVSSSVNWVDDFSDAPVGWNDSF